MNPLHTQRFFYRWTYQPWAFDLVDRLAEPLPREAFQAVARSVAGIYCLTHPNVARTVAENLSLFLKRPATRWETFQVFQHFSAGMADYCWLGRRTLDEAASHCIERSGIEHLEEAQKEGRGAILATGHYSFFEYGAMVLGHMGLPVTVLTLSEPNDELTQLRADYRTRWGARTIEIGQDHFQSLEVVRELGKNQLCAMLVDRPTLGGNIRVDLPGGSTQFSTSAAVLAHLADCPILPVTIRRVKDGNYRLIACPPVRVNREMPRDSAINEASLAVANALSEEIGLDPLQWFQFVPVRL